MTTPEPTTPSSPKWDSTTKTIFGLTMVALIVALLVTFRNIIGPLILAFILAYLLFPIARRMRIYLRFSWRLSVNLIYIFLVVLLIAFVTSIGIAIVQQSQVLVVVVERFINGLPELLATLSQQQYMVGPFPLDLSQYNLATLAERLLSYVQPLLGQAGGLLSGVATGALSTLGWLAFIIIISYFLMAESSQVSGRMVQLNIPGYNADLRLLGRKLVRVWDAYLRGQLIISMLVVIVYFLLMTALGMRFTFTIAILAGLARFVPYVGPLITWTITGLVALIMQDNYFNLESWQYALLVIGLALLVDQVFDNLVVPRVMGTSLGVHPAAVLVAAIVAANLMGLIGLVLAAPVLASISLVGRYIVRKLFDLDPWPTSEPEIKTVELPWARLSRRIKEWRHSRQKVN